MSYQVLARKWRPQTFSEVVGQEHITRTLQNAILQNRVGHAYLFVGARGIGKTTTARIFAKALNCGKGIVSEPCCECESCREIASGSSLDVIEIDGASHNKVDDIRDIRDNVQYTPSRSRYKIYIIDEVHMLTTAAWNALLKTLEEPPPHVKFLFATTEPHKVLPTIVSRCQRFDLKRIPAPMIVSRLRQIADKESIHVEDSALAAIARAADGGMRDGQSIFDQIIAFCGGLEDGEIIREQDVIDVFGLASGMELRTLAVSLFTNDLDSAIGVIQELADHGRDLERVYADLVSFVRNVLIGSVCRDPKQILEATSSELEDLVGIGRAVDGMLVQRILQGLVSQEWSFRSALNKRVHLEASIARIMLEAHSVQLDQVIAQLNALREGGVAGDAPAPTAPPLPKIPPPPEAEPGPPPAVPKPMPSAELPPIVERPSPPPKPASDVGAGTAVVDEVPPAPDSSDSPLPAEETVPPDPAPLQQVESSVPESLAASSEPISPASDPEADIPEPDLASADVSDEAEIEDTERPSSEPVDEVISQEDASLVEEDMDVVSSLSDSSAVSPGETASEDTVEVLDAQRAWELLLVRLADHANGQDVVNWMRQLKPVSLHQGILQLAYDEDFPADRLAFLQEETSESVIAECYASVSSTPGSRVVIKRWIADLSDDQRSVMRRATPDVSAKVAEKPFVKQVIDLFDGELIDVRIQHELGDR